MPFNLVSKPDFLLVFDESSGRFASNYGSIPGIYSIIQGNNSTDYDWHYNANTVLSYFEGKTKIGNSMPYFSTTANTPGTNLDCINCAVGFRIRSISNGKTQLVSPTRSSSNGNISIWASVASGTGDFDLNISCISSGLVGVSYTFSSLSFNRDYKVAFSIDTTNITMCSGNFILGNGSIITSDPVNLFSYSWEDNWPLLLRDANYNNLYGLDGFLYYFVYDRGATAWGLPDLVNINQHPDTTIYGWPATSITPTISRMGANNVVSPNQKSVAVYGANLSNSTISISQTTSNNAVLGSPVTFSKANNATPLPSDNIDYLLSITRGAGGAIYNSKLESGFDYYTSPLGTLWNGDGWTVASDLNNVKSRSYTDLYELLGLAIGNNIVNKPLVMHDLINDKYYAIVFTFWQSGGNGGGFTYTRRLITFPDAVSVPQTITSTTNSSAVFDFVFDTDPNIDLSYGPANLKLTVNSQTLTIPITILPSDERAWVNITTTTNSINRISATPDIAAGDQIEVISVTGTNVTISDVSLYDDGSFDTSSDVSEFSYRIYSGTDYVWGTSATETRSILSKNAVGRNIRTFVVGDRKYSDIYNVSIPPTISVLSIGQTTVAIGILDGNNVTTRTAQIKRVADSIWTNSGIIQSGTSTYLFSSLTPSTAYNIRIKCDNAYYTNYTNVLTVNSTIITSSPTAPIITAGSVNINSISFTISGGANATSWAVQYKLASDSVWITTGASMIVGDTSYILTGLQTSSAYDIRIHATNPYGSADSNIINLTTLSGSVGSTSVTTMTLTSAAGGSNLPWMTGHFFAKGDVPAGQSLTTNTAGVTLRSVIKRTWADGSAKHAILLGTATLTSGIAKTVNIITGPPASGTNLTSSNITAAAPTASINCAGIGSVSLSTLLSSPVRTWISTPNMVECHYRGDIGSSLMSAWFHVRLYADGRMWVRAICENGYLDNGAGAVSAGLDRTYVPTITIGGTVVYNNGGTSLIHYNHTRYMAEGWIGTVSDVQPTHNVAYMRSTKLVPSYGYTGASSATLNGLNGTYIPMDHGPQTINMGDTGFQAGIGLLPNWCALYATTGDARAFKAVLCGSSSLNSYPIVFRSKNTNDIIKPSSFGNWNPSGPAGGGEDSRSAGPYTWEINHHTGDGYLAYAITGDYWHLETCAMNASNSWLYVDSGKGSGTSRLLTRQTRGTAWCLRSVGLYGAIAPDDQLTTGQVAYDYRALLEYNYSVHKATADSTTGRMQWAGSLYQYEYGRWPSDPTTGGIAPWMTDFWVSVNGFLSDIEPCTSTTNLSYVRDWMYKFTVGRLGESGISGDFDFTRAAQYGIVVSTTNLDSGWYQSWGDIHNATFGSYNTSVTNILQGTSGADPAVASTGYWGNLLPALCYAVDHKFTGADIAYARLTGATNWSTAAATFNDTPVFGCAPRVSAFSPSYSLPTTTNASTLIGTNTALSVKPSNYSDAEFDNSTFKPFGGGVFNPNYSVAGAFSLNNTGGHNDAYFPGSIIFDLLNATWTRLDNSNGIPYQSSFTYYETVDCNALPYRELTAATSGNFPCAGHVYGSQCFLNEGSKGSVIWVTRGAVAYESGPAPSAHKLDQATGLWTRAATGTAADTAHVEGSACYDPNTNVYYVSHSQFWDNNFVAYLRMSDSSWQTRALSNYPPSGTNYAKLFMFPQRRLLLMNDQAGDIFALDLSVPAGSTTWVKLTTTGSFAGNNGSNTFVYHPRTGKFYQKYDNISDTLNTLTPPTDRALGTGGTWTKGSVTITGAGLPDRTIDNSHYTCLQYAPSINSLIWVAGTTQSVAVIKV
jgi:hypothetical protein